MEEMIGRLEMVVAPNKLGGGWRWHRRRRAGPYLVGWAHGTSISIYLMQDSILFYIAFLLFE